MCEKCEGTGIVTVYDRVPYGSTTVDMPSSDVCDCCEFGCPYCGEDAIWDEDAGSFVTCHSCGWNIEAQTFYDEF